MFAVALFRPIVGILNWTKEENGRIDTESRKILTMTASFHPKSDTSRKDGGRGILSISDVHCCRMISPQEQLEIMKVTNTFLLEVYQHEEQNIIRISSEIKDLDKETTERIQQAGSRQEQVAEKFKEVLNADRLEKWRKKPIHGYIDRKVRENDDIRMKESYAWLQSENYSSHIEGYLFFMQE